jgi:hypothetical protein
VVDDAARDDTDDTARDDTARDDVATLDDVVGRDEHVTPNGVGERNGSSTDGTVEVARAPEPHLPQFVPAREPIDWDQVAKERAAARNKVESTHRRNILVAVIAALVTLGVLYLLARNVGDDGDGDDATEQSSTTVAPQSSSTTVEPSSTSPDSTLAPATTLPPGTVSVFALQPGTCVQNPELLTGRVETVVEVPCEQSHTHEVYHKVTYTPPDGAYDEARISQFASEQCTQSFATYVGIPFDRSRYYYVQFSPTQESWTQRGDREVVCLLFQQGAQLTGSARGSAQ